MNELTLFLGRFHPLLVHFPIVLLVLAGRVRSVRLVGAADEPVRRSESAFPSHPLRAR